MTGDRLVGFDLESSGLSPWRDRIATVQLYGDESGTAALIQTPRGKIPSAIKDILEDPRKLFVVHNGVSFDIPFLHTHGVDVNKASWFDTLVAETAIVPNQRRDVSKSLRASLKRRLEVEVDKDVDHSGWENPVLTDTQVGYAMRDVLHLPALRDAQLQRAEAAGVTKGLEMETRLVLPTAWLTINGLPISLTKLNEYLDQQRSDISKVTAEFVAEFRSVNARSPKQLLGAFAAKGFNLEDTRKETLLELELGGGEVGQLAHILLEYRRPDQRLKIYNDGWVAKHVQPDGRVHARFWQCSTDTTRFSSSDPNFEQWPQDMRWVIGWEEGKVVVAVDLSQIEIRVMAAIAKDQALLQALEAEDVHTAIASTVFGVPEAEVSFDMRKLAKGMSFTILFGGGVPKLYDYARLGGSSLGYEDVSRVVEAFLDRFRGIKALREQAYALADAGRPVTVRIPSGLKRTLFGHKLRPTTILNTMVQSTAAAGIKFGMLEAWDRGLWVGKVGNQVHDELVAVVAKDEAAEYGRELADAMEVGFRRAIDCNPRTRVKVNDFWEK